MVPAALFAPGGRSGQSAPAGRGAGPAGVGADSALHPATRPVWQQNRDV